MLIMINVEAWEWQLAPDNFLIHLMWGRHSVPLQVMWTVSPNTVSGILRICWGFEPVSLVSRLHGNDNRGYDILKMINVGARRAVPLQVMWTVSRTPFWEITHMQRFWTGSPGFPFAREWQSGLWFVNNDKRRGTARRAPTNDVNGSLNTVSGIILDKEISCFH